MCTYNMYICCVYKKYINIRKEIKRNAINLNEKPPSPYNARKQKKIPQKQHTLYTISKNRTKA